MKRGLKKGGWLNTFAIWQSRNDKLINGLRTGKDSRGAQKTEEGLLAT
jgi:hypothetical protein